MSETVDRYSPWGLAKSGTEHAEQVAYFAAINRMMWAGLSAAQTPTLWEHSSLIVQNNLALNSPAVPELRWLHAIPNGGERAKIVASQMKAEGVKSGVADIFLPVASSSDYCKNYGGIYYGFYIEMKRKTGKPSDLSDNQKLFREFVRAQGYAWCWCRGWEQARDRLIAYLRGEWRSDFETIEGIKL